MSDNFYDLKKFFYDTQNLLTKLRKYLRGILRKISGNLITVAHNSKSCKIKF